MKVVRCAVAVAAAATFSALAPGAETSTDSLRAQLAIERRRLAADARDLRDIARRIDAAVQGLSDACREAAETADASSAEQGLRREDVVADREAELHKLLERRRQLAERILDRRRGIEAIEQEIRSRVSDRPDLISGRWRVSIDPGDQRGVFRLSLDGALISGEFELDGGFSGSLRGTLTDDRVRLERVDLKLGPIAVYYGRLSKDGGTLAGTWELSNLSAGTPATGRWRATRVKVEP